MNRERLQHLITVLERVRPGLFEMSHWFDPNRPAACGTVACVVGHACLDPDFQAQGLEARLGMPKYAGYTGWDAAEVFFGLDPIEALHLFCEDSYPKDPMPADVIERIRNLLISEPT